MRVIDVIFGDVWTPGDAFTEWNNTGVYSRQYLGVFCLFREENPEKVLQWVIRSADGQKLNHNFDHWPLMEASP